MEQERERFYIGAKLITAHPLDERSFLERYKNENLLSKASRPGYKVTYPDGYISWSPKDVFESAYREVTDGEKALSYV